MNFDFLRSYSLARRFNFFLVSWKMEWVHSNCDTSALVYDVLLVWCALGCRRDYMEMEGVCEVCRIRWLHYRLKTCKVPINLRVTQPFIQ